VQFILFILLTVRLVQRGSPESKELGKSGRESDEDQKVGEHADERSPRWARASGIRRRIYENSPLLVMGPWVATWFAQSTRDNSDRLDHQQAAVSSGEYLTRPGFWEKTLQKLQSQFLAVGSVPVLAVYVRQRGSPESKPVGAAHDSTGVAGGPKFLVVRPPVTLRRARSGPPGRPASASPP
jgi:hypothetical protein